MDEFAMAAIAVLCIVFVVFWVLFFIMRKKNKHDSHSTPAPNTSFVSGNDATGKLDQTENSIISPAMTDVDDLLKRKHLLEDELTSLIGGATGLLTVCDCLIEFAKKKDGKMFHDYIALSSVHFVSLQEKFKEIEMISQRADNQGNDCDKFKFLKLPYVWREDCVLLLKMHSVIENQHLVESDEISESQMVSFLCDSVVKEYSVNRLK